MIVTLPGHDRHLYPKEVDQMFRLRADMFARRLGWKVSVKDGWETDELDECDPLYLLSIHGGDVAGCARLLPTTGATQLNTYFKNYFDEPVEIRSPNILEATRFAVTEGTPQGLSRRGVSLTTVELLLAICVIMKKSGCSFCLALYDPTALRVYRRAGWTPQIIGKSRDARIEVGLLEVGDALIDKLCATNGLDPDDVVPRDAASVLSASPKAKSA